MMVDQFQIHNDSAHLADSIPQNPAMTVRSVDISTIRKATGNFSEGNMIGQGGFGIVYKV